MKKVTGDKIRPIKRGSPTIAVGLSVYHDYESLQRCIQSLVNKVDLVIAIYGRYHNFGDHLYKGDPTKTETHKYLKQFDNILIIDQDGSQVSKRDNYLQVAAANKIDCVIVVDADEWIQECPENGGWEDFRKELKEVLDDPYLKQPQNIHNLYGIWEQYGTPEQVQSNPRVIIRPEQCQYYYHHNYVKNKNKGYRLWAELPFSRGIILRGDDSLRDAQREAYMTRYEKVQTFTDEKET